MSEPTTPLVSVICLCYNHKDYVKQAIESVFDQTYNNIELIVVDDASTDGSNQVIEDSLKGHANTRFIALNTNLGNCAAFNRGWRVAEGKYVIDLAADDFLLSERVAIGVDALEKAGPDYGVHYADARIIDKSGTLLFNHLTASFTDNRIPEGYIFDDLLRRYFINPVTMMYANKMLESLNGYDESLSYEDFDLWVRSSKTFKYCFTPKILVVKRQLQDSHGKKQYRPGSTLLRSTYLVCEKAFDLCELSTEYEALLIRINYEMKRAVFSLNWIIAARFIGLRKRVLQVIATL